MTALENILSQEIIQRLGWTLLHFVWQAAATALLLAVLLAALRKASANLRYTIACLALGLIVLLPAVTMQLVGISVAQPPMVSEPAPAPVVLPTEQIREIPMAETPVVERPAELKEAGTITVVPWKQRAREQLESSLPYIVIGWLLGVFALSLWHLGGWTQLQRLRRKMVVPVDASLRAKLDELAEKLAVKQAVQLTESALVQIPTVVGWLRPVILLPASALTGLTAEQLEAILAHELAHIHRHDYLVNMLQTVVEILGFYHPAVWWISHRIRVERENCCDDLAVSISGDRVGYARALASMEGIRTARSGLAVAATGGNLLRRIGRLLGKDSTNSSRASWIPSVITILLIATIAVPTTLVLNADSQSQQSKLEINVQAEDEEPGSAKTAGTKEPTAEDIRIVHFPKDRAVGTLKVRIARMDEESDRGLLSPSGWILFHQAAQGDVNVHASIELRLEVSEDVTDFSFLADLEPNDLEVLTLSHTKISNEELVNLTGLTGLLGLHLGGTAIKGEGLAHIVPLTSLRKLSLFNTQVSDTGLEHLSTLTSLKHLNLCVTQVKGPGLKYLKNLTSLVSLDLAATPITDENLVYLAELPWLKELEIYDTDITDKGLAHLRPLRSLEVLIVGKSGLRHDYSPITDEGLIHLKELDSLKHLYLLQTRVTDAGLAHLSTLTKLEYLNLTETQITGEGLVFLKDLPALTYLNLKQTGVGRAGLAQLKEMTKLRNLELGEVSLGQSDLKDLENALPNCTVNAKRASISITPATVESPVSSGEDERHILVDCRVLEIYTSMKIDRETTIATHNLLGEKTPPRIPGKPAPTIEEFIRKVAKTTVLGEKPSIMTTDGQRTQKIVDLLVSRGYMKVLMNPTLEVMDGGKGRVSSTQRVPMGKATAPSTQSDRYVDIIDYFEITPHVRDDSGIKLLTEGTINTQVSRQDKGRPPVFDKFSLSYDVVVGPGMSLIMSGTQETDGGAEASERPQTKVLFIFTPTIVDTDEPPDETDQEQEESKMEGETQQTDKIVYPRNWREIVGKRARQVEDPIALDREDAQMHRRLETIVDLPGLSSGMSFDDVIGELEEAVDPPLQIQPNWKDLREAAGIEPTTPVGMKPLTDVKLGKALEILLAGVSSESAKVRYVVDRGVVVIATPKALPRNMITRVYHIADLLGGPDDHRGLSRVMQAHNLVQLIQKRVDPESWYDLDIEGEGTITPYPMQEPKKLAVYNTLKTHRGIQRLLEDMRRSRVEKENPILIETRILTATDDFLKSIGLDANSVRTSEIWSEHLLADSAAEPNSQRYNLILDDLNVSLLLKATRMPESKGVKSLSSLIIRTLAGQPKEEQMVPHEYRFGRMGGTHRHFVETESDPERAEVGTFIRVLPNLTADKKNIRLDVEWELRRIRGFKERFGSDKKKHKFPLIAVDNIKTTAVIPEGKTLLVGRRITEEAEVESRTPILGDLPLVGGLFRNYAKITDQRTLLILIRATVDPKPPPTKPLDPDDPPAKKLTPTLRSSGQSHENALTTCALVLCLRISA